ncbi:hypothetical protein QVD99_004345 [Batrachochytrium dendrobatidis]|nr:hypothetical protein O5D80_002097 [Batrachochytrium dendrobatidis]KAK5669973.1 hypothetical protein QVD99_004345 [Batrachochytrium dendrobatidis]
MEQLLFISQEALADKLQETASLKADAEEKARLVSSHSKACISAIQTEAIQLKASLEEGRVSILKLANSFKASKDPKLSQLSSSLALIKRLEAAEAELQSLCKIHESEEFIHNCINRNDLASAIDHYCSHFGLPESTIKPSSVDLDAPFVNAHFMSASDYWRSSIHKCHALIHKNLSITAAPFLLEISWPKPIDEHSSKSVMSDLITLLGLSAKLQHPRSILDSSSLPTTPFAYMIEPVELLLSPIRKHFKFHFHGNLPTNSLERPDLYFKYILKIMKDQQSFFEESIQLLLDNDDGNSINTTTVFFQGLVDLITRKVCQDLHMLLDQPSLFLHTIEQVFLFEEQVQELLSFSVGATAFEKGCSLVILGNDTVFSVWVDLEKQAADTRFQKILSRSDKWDLTLSKMDDIDDDHMTVLADQTKSLLLVISERMSHLQLEHQRLVFLKSIQIPILLKYLDLMKQEHWHHQSTFIPVNDARYTLQFRGGRISHLARCLGSLHSISVFLSTYKTEQQCLSILQDTSDDGLVRMDNIYFDVLEKMSVLIQEISKTAIDDIMLDICESLWEYEKRVNWLDNINDSSASEPVAISTTLQEPLQIMRHYFGCVEKSISPTLFRSLFLRPVTKLLDLRLWEKVIMRSQFSFYGGCQILLDMRLGFMNALQPFHPTPAALLPRILEASTILALPCKAKDTDSFDIYEFMLASIENSHDFPPMLERLDIFHLSIKDIQEVIGRRIETFGDF